MSAGVGGEVGEREAADCLHANTHQNTDSAARRSSRTLDETRASFVSKDCTWQDRERGGEREALEEWCKMMEQHRGARLDQIKYNRAASKTLRPSERERARATE